MKKFLIFVVVVLVVVGVIAVSLPYIIDINRYKGLIIEKAQDAIQRKVEAGEIRLNLIGGVGVMISDFKLYEDISGRGAPFISSDRIVIRLEVLPLIRKEVKVSKILVDTPNIIIKRDAEGNFNFLPRAPKSTAPGKRVEERTEPVRGEQGKKGDAPKSGSKVPETKKEPQERFKVALGSLQIKNGRLDLTDDYVKPSTKLLLTDCDISLSDFEVGGRMKFSVSGILNKSGNINISGSVGRIPEGFDFGSNLDKLSFKCNANCTGMDLSPLLPYIKESAPELRSLSGDCDLNIKCSGSMADSTFIAGVNATNLAVVYGGFEKPKGVRVSVDCDGSISGGNTIDVKRLKVVYGNSNIDLSGNIANFNKPGFKRLKMDAQARIQLSDFGTIEAVKVYKPDGKITADMDIEGNPDKLDELQMSGTVNADNVKLYPFPEPTKKVTLNGALVLKGETVNLQGLNITAGTSHLSVQGTLRGFENPEIDVDATMKRCDVEELLKLIPERQETAIPRARRVTSSEPVKAIAPSDTPETGTVVKAQRVDTGPYKKGIIERALIKANLFVNEIIYKKNDLTNLTAQVVVRDGVLTLNNFNVLGYEGKLTGSLTYKLVSPLNEFSSEFEMAGVDINDILSKNTGLKDRIYGKLDGKIMVTGSGQDIEVIKKNVNGKGDIGIKDGRFASFSILRNLSLISGIVGLDLPDIKDTTFKDLTLTVDIQNGVCRTNDLDMKTKYFDLFGKGYFTLSNEIDYDLDVKFTKDFTERMGKGELQRALTGSDGRMMMPFKVSGAIDGPPKFKPNWGNIIQREAEYRLKKTIEDKIFKDKDQQGEQPQEESSTKSGWKGMLMDVITDSMEGSGEQK